MYWVSDAVAEAGMVVTVCQNVLKLKVSQRCQQREVDQEGMGSGAKR